jgi:hypothetical protein
MTSSGIETVTFLLVTQYLNQLRRGVPPSHALDILQTIAQLEYPFSPSVCRRRIFLFRNY